MRCGEVLRTISSCSDVRVEVGVVPGVSMPGCCDCARSGECVAMPPMAMAAPVISCRRVRPGRDEAPYCGAESLFAFMRVLRGFAGSAQSIGTCGQIMFKNIFCSPEE